MVMSMGWSVAGGSSVSHCRNCGHQATLTAGTTMQATTLALTT